MDRPSRRDDDILTDLLVREQVATHPFIIGELAIGNLQPRAIVLRFLQKLDRVIVAHDDEVLRLIEQEHLFGLGAGYVDAHLLASVRLTPDTSYGRMTSGCRPLLIGLRSPHASRTEVRPGNYSTAALVSARRLAYSARRFAAIGAT